jgi:RNA polymerase sigma-70 factor, ECF subfamily
MDETATHHLPRLVSQTGSAPGSLAREFEASLGDLGPLAFRVAFGVLRRREDAEDVAQEALTRAYRKLPTLRERDRCRAWVVRIAWRLAIDHRRSWKRREHREQAAAPDSASPSAEAVVVANEFRDRLWQAIDTLPEKLRVAIVLAGIHEHDLREVALLLQLPEGTVKSRLHRARKELAERLR